MKVMTAERQPAHRTIVKQINKLTIVAFNRLQLPVAGTSDGNVNTNKAALVTNCPVCFCFRYLSPFFYSTNVCEKERNRIKILCQLNRVVYKMSIDLHRGLLLEAIALIAMPLNCLGSM